MRLTHKTCRKWIGKMVRVDPGHCTGHNNGGAQHKHAGLLKGVRGNKALIRPIRHGRDEWVPLTACHTWVAGNHPRD